MKTYSSRPGQGERQNDLPCDLCGSIDLQFLYTSGAVSYYTCRTCGLVSQNPRPEQKDLLDRYDGAYYDYEIENEKQFFSLMLLALQDVRFFSQIADGMIEAKFLDIGCATGMLLEYLQKKRKWQVQGVEVCTAAADYGRKERGLSIFTGTLDQARFQDGMFDVVHASHVIEHVSSPGEFLAEIYRVLKPGGAVIITTPNISGFQSKLFKDKWRSAIPDHMYLFSVKTLKRYFMQSGFTIMRKKTWGGIAKDVVSPGLKKGVDRLAKAFGIGDVMVFLGRKETVQ